MKFIFYFFTIVLSYCPTVFSDQTDDIKRVKEITGIISEKPCGLGTPISDRTFWKKISETPEFAGAIEAAEKFLGKPVPELTDSLYLDYLNTGNRDHYQQPLFERRNILNRIVIAECMENKGRFLPDIENYTKAICSEKTWVLPAHDRGLDNFHGKREYVDLVVATTSLNMATVHYLIGEKLQPDTRLLIENEVKSRALDPYMKLIKTGNDTFGWVYGKGNWNAVCMAGLTGAACELVKPAEDRAWYLLGVEKFSHNYIDSFEPDGYSYEGLGYWNYGFGNFIVLTEIVKKATGGKWDIMENGLAKSVAMFPPNIEILPGVFPAFADCDYGTMPSYEYMRYLDNRFDLGVSDWTGYKKSVFGQLHETALFYLENEKAAPIDKKNKKSKEIRHWFDNYKILVSRPRSGVENGLGAVMTGGENSNHHNHNDVGTYVVGLMGKTILIDPGKPVYTYQSLGPTRYEDPYNNSFGHPVPRVAGKLQKSGENTSAVLISKDFTDSRDTLIFDIKAAYDVPELTKLERSFDYSRSGRCSLTITDRVAYTSPQSFETAIITLGKWSTRADGTLLIQDGESKVSVEITTVPAGYNIVAESIKEAMPNGMHPVRIGIVLKNPVTDASVSLMVKPIK